MSAKIPFQRPKRGFLQQSPKACHLIGCVHVLPLPGSPRWQGDMRAVVDLAVREAEVYASAGVDGIIIENMHDTPYLRMSADAGTIAGMAMVAQAVRTALPDIVLGIQILAAADIAALEVAVAGDLDFLRCEGFVFAHTADEGIIQGNAARLVRRRAHLNVNHIEIWTDVKKKHSAHALTADLSLREFAEGAAFFDADAVIVTGNATGTPPKPADLLEVAGLGVRTAVGSGMTPDNLAEFARNADALIVGSYCKVDGDWRKTVSAQRVRDLVQRLSASV
ncbi:MAG TPA: BtpA/SgcQ family protein [Anaerolineales bacterium]|nr:BtpA/SgcQ family protein [Anaerolineales bacterium]